MSKFQGFERIYREDIPHALVGAGLSGLNQIFGGFVPIPLDCCITGGIGWLRERVQMYFGKDISYGRDRARDALGFIIGSVIIDAIILAIMT